MTKHALTLSAAAMLVLASPTVAQQSDEAQPAPSSPSYESNDIQQIQPQASSEQTQPQASAERDESEHEPQNAYGRPADPAPSAQVQSSPSQYEAQLGQSVQSGQADVRFYIVRPTDLRASDLIGMKVYNAQNEQIGDVADLVLDEGANLKAIVLDVGTFLGGGDRDIAVEPDTVVIEQQTPSGHRIVIHVTRENLQSAPEFKMAQAPQPARGDPNQQ